MNWSDGTKKPSAPAREKLSAAPFRIPVEAWDEAPANGAAPDSSPKLALDRPTENETGPDYAIRAARQLHDHILADPSSTPREKWQAVREFMSAVERHNRITGAGELGPKLFRLPIWQRVEAAMARALKGHPEALKDLRDELRRVEDELARGGTG